MRAIPESVAKAKRRSPVANPFAANDVGTVYAHGRPYHHPRTLARVRALVGNAPITRGLDVAWCTGMSTVALRDQASTVIGVDISPEMMRAAARPPGVSYLFARSEVLPFAERSFDAVTCCSGVHWFDQPRFFTELRRVLRPGGWVALYDHYFIGEMEGVPEFPAWSSALLDRYPLPPRTPQVGDPRADMPDEFEKVGEEFFGEDIEMTQDAFVDYQLSLSHCVSAVEQGTSRDDVRAWLMESTASFFAGVPARGVRFLGSVTCFRPART